MSIPRSKFKRVFVCFLKQVPSKHEFVEVNSSNNFHFELIIYSLQLQ